MLELSESKSAGGKLLIVPVWLGEGYPFPPLPFWCWLVLGCAGTVDSP